VPAGGAESTDLQTAIHDDGALLLIARDAGSCATRCEFQVL
jgi:hypothetical protein